MNNLSSYCGLVDAKIGASDKDLPVSLHCTALWLETINMYVETWCVEILMNEGQLLFFFLLVVFYCFSFSFP